ncbi:MAG: Gfo/Idh/MocA family oxidoreductase [Candidatus Hydrogenedentes bacterium]|nr:Gfo/Idh/MocA family oxidoreductase [Candidatus Hydrogenedentota bacterium]
MAKNKLRAGVVGFGYLGYHHARIYKELDNVELVGIVDISEDRRKKAEKDFKVPAYQHFSELISQGVDIVSVATPTVTHTEVALPILDAGIHLLIEKPLADTMPNAKLIVEKAKERKCILQVGHIERFNGAVKQLFHLIEKPLFIECHRLSPFPNRGTDVSVVLDLMIHDVDIVLKLTNSDVIQIDAVGVPVFSESEDIANVRLRFSSGCVANITASRVSMDRLRKIRIFSTQEYVSTDYTSQSLLLYRKRNAPIPKNGNLMDMIEITPISVSNEEPLRAEIKSFVNSVLSGTLPEVTGEDALKALELCWKIINQIRNQE